MSNEEREALEILKGFEPDDLVECAIYLQAMEKITNIIEKQSKEIEEAEQKEKKAYIDGTNDAHELCNKKWEEKIKAKIGERMQKNNNIIHNAKLKYGKDYVYYDDVQEAKEENCICKEVLQSLLEKE